MEAPANSVRTVLVGGSGELGSPDVRLNEHGLYSAVSTVQRAPGAIKGLCELCQPIVRGRRPGLMPEESYYFRDGEWVRGRTDGRNPEGLLPREPSLTTAGTARTLGRRTGARSWETGELDAGLYERQTAGIATLIALANDVAATRSGETISSTAGGEGKQSRLSVLSRLLQDEMTLNSLYLVMSTGLQAGFGFVFWIMTARLFSVSDVGKGSALISATSLIGYVALLGLNIGMGRYLPNSRNRDALISSGLTMVAVCGAVGALLYILLTPLMAPGLAFVEKSPILAASFVLIASATAVNSLTDVIFVASRKAKYATFVDGVIGGFGKVVMALLLTGAGAYGLFLASAMGTVLAAVASLILILTAMHARLDLRKPLVTLKPLIRFSGANYIGSIFNMLPGLVVPLMLLDSLGAKSAAYFFVVFQIAQIVYAAAFALEGTFLAEGSRADADMHKLPDNEACVLLCSSGYRLQGYYCHWALVANRIRTAVLSSWLHKSDYSGSGGRSHFRELLVPHRSSASGYAPCYSCRQCNVRYWDMLVCVDWIFSWIDSRSMGMAAPAL